MEQYNISSYIIINLANAYFEDIIFVYVSFKALAITILSKKELLFYYLNIHSFCITNIDMKDQVKAKQPSRLNKHCHM